MRMQKRRPPGHRAARGMTLIEIVIVIVLIGGILAVVGSRIVGNKERAEHKLAQTQVQTLLEKVQQYESDVGALPDSLEALVKQPGNADGWLGPYAKESELKDPWKTPIELRRSGGAGFELVSLGADRKAGGEGVDGDIVVSP